MATSGAGNGEVRRLTRQGRERKQQLLDHAARLFAERGYADTRVADIVRDAGVAKGLFYWYFENKEALFRELVEGARHRMRQMQADAIDPEAPALVRIRQGVEASLRFMSERRRLYSMFDLDGLDPELARTLRAGGEVHTHDTARHIREGIADGTIRDEDPLLLAYGVVGTVAYFNHLHRITRIEGDLDDIVPFVGRFVVRALASDDEAAERAERAVRAGGAARVARGATSPSAGLG